MEKTAWATLAKFNHFDNCSYDKNSHTLYHSRGLPDWLGNIIFGIIGEEEGQGYLGTHPLGKEF